MVKYLLQSLAALLFLILSLTIIYNVTSIQGSSAKVSDVEKRGISYISKMEKQNMKSIEEQIAISQSTQSQGAQNVAQPSVGGNSSDKELQYARTYFGDSVFMGDSQTEPYTFYDILDDKNVLAVKGRNVYTALGDVDTVASRNPKRLYLLYGMNDLQLYKSGNQFIENYENLVKKIKEKLPDTKIFIESVLPTTAAIRQQIPDYSLDRVELFNSKIETMCKKLKINYVDIRGLIDSEKIYEPDGVHLQLRFYNKLIVYLMKNAS